jgi:hypothetical protein
MQTTNTSVRVLDKLDNVATPHEVIDRKVQIVPYRNIDNNIDGVVLLLVDITDLKGVEQALRTSYEDVSRFNRVAVDREMRLIELKKEVNDLCERLGLQRRYPLEFERPEGEP